jgi:hypothetical protein
VNEREAVARAVAFFDRCDDVQLLHTLSAEIAPRARRLVIRHLQRAPEEAIPAPADLRGAREPATRDEAARAVRATQDFALLQVLARAIGQRVEVLEIAASADFPVGARVEVPERPRHPRAGAVLEGTVERTGTSLQVLLDNGETWEGPPTLARLVRIEDGGLGTE